MFPAGCGVTVKGVVKGGGKGKLTNQRGSLHIIMQDTLYSATAN